MPINLLIVCTIAGALAAAVLMNWGVRKSKQYKREGRLVAQTLTGMPVFILLTSLAAALGAVEWANSHDLADEAAGTLMLGILVGAVSADLKGFGLGSGEDSPDDVADGDDGADGGGE
jgi:hypothetical protein